MRVAAPLSTCYQNCVDKEQGSTQTWLPSLHQHTHGTPFCSLVYEWLQKEVLHIEEECIAVRQPAADQEYPDLTLLLFRSWQAEYMKYLLFVNSVGQLLVPLKLFAHFQIVRLYWKTIICGFPEL
jgi:hypothetical protein